MKPNGYKSLLIFIGTLVFLWGVIYPNWIRMIGGMLLLILMAFCK